MDEKMYLQAIASDNIQAFEQLFLTYQPKLIFFLKGFLHDEESSRDMAQEIFLSLWINRNKLKNVRSFSAYLFQIARYNIYNHFDRLLVHEKYTIEQIIQLTESTSLEEEIFLKDLQEYIETIVRNMPPQRQRIFRMSRYDGLTNEEIAQQLQINRRTVENHLSAALSDLRKVLFYLCFFL